MTVLSKRALGKAIDLSILRHSIATINYNKDGVKDSIVAEQMGHGKSMKNNYTHNDLEKLKENAKKIYLGELPPEKRTALEKEIHVLKSFVSVILKMQGWDEDEIKEFDPEETLKNMS